MSGADEAGASRPRVGPYLTGVGAEAPDLADNAETQLIPMVDGDPASGTGGAPSRVGPEKADGSKVRAVARRAAAALPALGSDGRGDVPASAKSTAERRRRAQAQAPQPDAANAAILGQPVPSASKHAAPISEFPPIPEFPPVPEPPAVRRPAPPVVAPPVVAPSVPPATLVPAPRRPLDDAETVTNGVPVDRAAPATDGDETVAASVEPVRPGPPLLEADSWDVPPDRHLGNDLYQGRRRATVPWGRILLVVALLVAVGAIFIVPWAFSGSSGPAAGNSGGPGVSDGGVEPGATNAAGELVSAASSPGARHGGQAGKSAVPSGAASAASAGPAIPTSPAGHPTTTSPVPPPAGFTTVSLQAESATVSAPSWQTDTKPVCTAGTPVVRTGKWLEYSNTPGSITFAVSMAAAGSYKITIYSVVSAGTGTRQVEMYVNNASVIAPDFPEGCLLARSVTVSLGQGSNQIRFTNQNARGPSIDRIEISKA